jgi:Fe-S-cluster containining protein
MLHKVPQLAGYDTGNGVCCYLCHDLCKIYEQRPEICNIEKMYNTFFLNAMNENDFILENLKSCVRIAQEFEAEPIVAKLNEILKEKRTSHDM